MKSLDLRVLGLTVAVACASVGSTSCAPILNRDPNLRWWAFKNYGTSRICPEILKTSIPLKAGGDQTPVVGRYFPSSCSTSIDEQSRTVIVNIGGSGYAYLPGTKRVTFTLTIAPQYKFDFHMHKDGNWVWGKLARVAGGPDFRFSNSDNKIVDIAARVTPIGPVANVLASSLVNGFISKGFTVVETSDGMEFALGILPPGVRPMKPIKVDDDSAYTFANEVTDIRSGQQDFLGPFEVADDGQAIMMRGTLVGRSGVDFIVVPKQMGDIWRQSYQGGAGPTRPPGPAMGVVGVPPGPFTRKFKLKRGLYYVVVDNSRAVGQQFPQFSLPNPFFDPAVRLTYVAQLVDD